MRFSPSSLNEMLRSDFDTLIDVRSPSEFALDHIPGAINLPVLSDEERVIVGTTYVQDSAFKARKMGAAMVARNAASHIDEVLSQHDGAWRPLLYCWRGGQRSGSFAAILSQIGWRVSVLDGGYRTWRRFVSHQLYDAPVAHRLVLLDGNTGTAKTDILARLRQRGAQVIDLEGMANHRGSALGGQGEQPAQKAFESELASLLAGFDPERPILVEAESSKIGRINLPPRFFDAMRRAPRLEIAASVQDRATYLVEAYRDVTETTDLIESRLEKLVRLQGREKVDAWVALARAGAFQSLAEALIEMHYDPRYEKVRERVGARTVERFDAKGLSVEDRETLANAVFERLNDL